MKIYELVEELEELMEKALYELNPERFDAFIDMVEQIIVYYQDKNDDRW